MPVKRIQETPPPLASLFPLHPLLYSPSPLLLCAPSQFLVFVCSSFPSPLCSFCSIFPPPLVCLFFISTPRPLLCFVPSWPPSAASSFLSFWAPILCFLHTPSQSFVSSPPSLPPWMRETGSICKIGVLIQKWCIFWTHNKPHCMVYDANLTSGTYFNYIPPLPPRWPWVDPCGWEFNCGRGRGWESRPLSRFCFALVVKGT